MSNSVHSTDEVILPPKKSTAFKVQVPPFFVLLFQKSCRLFRYSFVNLHQAAKFLLERRGLLLPSLSNKPYLFSVFLIVLVSLVGV